MLGWLLEISCAESILCVSALQKLGDPGTGTSQRCWPRSTQPWLLLARRFWHLLPQSCSQDSLSCWHGCPKGFVAAFPRKRFWALSSHFTVSTWASLNTSSHRRPVCPSSYQLCPLSTEHWASQWKDSCSRRCRPPPVFSWVWKTCHYSSNML